jgi:hypothetical protein
MAAAWARQQESGAVGGSQILPSEAETRRVFTGVLDFLFHLRQKLTLS